MLLTTVVNLHTVRNWKKWMRNKNHIYIGRETKWLPASKWANPYRVEEYGRKTAVALYLDYLLRNKELLVCLEELRGKRLGCYCVPLLCHGTILRSLLAEPSLLNSLKMSTQVEPEHSSSNVTARQSRSAPTTPNRSLHHHQNPV